MMESAEINSASYERGRRDGYSAGFIEGQKQERQRYEEFYRHHQVMVKAAADAMAHDTKPLVVVALGGARNCLSCGAVTDPHGNLPCGH